jgi:hypothetical protein
VLLHNTNFWWLIFVSRYAFGEIETWKSRERGGGADADNMWKEMTTHIRKMIIEVFGVTRGNKREPKNTWLWNDVVQNVINEKKEYYKRLHHNRSDENIQKYKEARSTKKLEETQRKL